MAVWITNMSQGVSVTEHHPVVTAVATNFTVRGKGEFAIARPKVSSPQIQISGRGYGVICHRNEFSGMLIARKPRGGIFAHPDATQ
jgi:hypothetical protein